MWWTAERALRHRNMTVKCDDDCNATDETFVEQDSEAALDRADRGYVLTVARRRRNLRPHPGLRPQDPRGSSPEQRDTA
jgi:hypothetical protein